MGIGANAMRSVLLPSDQMTRLEGRRLGIPETGMLTHRTLASLLAPAELVVGRRACSHQRPDALLAWGRRPSARRVERLGCRWQIPVWHLEDGLVRSLKKGRDHPPLCLLIDDIGVHFDCTAPSRLEQRIASALTQAQVNRARLLRTLWCKERLSKLNPVRESPRPEHPYILVVDQSAGDLSIVMGGADAGCFQRMLQAALTNHPDHLIVVKVHPDVIHGRARGHFSPSELDHPRIRLCADGLHPAALLEHADAVYVVTSQMGFEALLWGRPVHCFGMPFYAGWGLTQDRQPSPTRRQHGASLEALVHACLIDSVRCIDPHQHAACEIEELMQSIGLQRRLQQQASERVEAFGFTPWKQKNLRRFLAGSELRFRRSGSLPDQRTTAVAVWGRRGLPALLQCVRDRNLPLLHVEDGFLRSVGLGADLIDPISWVIDRSGIYYDATGPSDLERLLSDGSWTDAQLSRAAALRQRLVCEAITKYNLPPCRWQRPEHWQRVVLVVGQVESDASIRFGAPGIKTNLGLLQAVRAAEPDAYLVYKPHPDVTAGLCRAGEGEDAAEKVCDEVLTGGAMQQMFSEIDALHVLTSLAGFEGLLRGVEVHCWGLPFYAGWGLTRDREQSSRRTRKLSLDALVHAALIEYPRYVGRESGWFMTAEQAIDELIAWRDAPPGRRTLVQAVFRHWGRLRRR